jgi:hypothetical protein
VPSYEAPAAPAASAQTSFVAQPVVQPLPARSVRTAAPAHAAPVRVAARPAPAVAAAPRNGSHLVQLGSFLSQQGARRAWGIYAAQNPELKNTRMTITQAVVRGRNYWRVAAGGLDGTSASGLCSTVKGRGGACFAYAPAPARATVPGQSAGGPLRARRR